MKRAMILSVLWLTAGAFAQSSSPPPGSINLLPGYVHQLRWGVDSTVGQIWKKDGLVIKYDIGDLAGNYTECGKLCGWTDGEVWRKKQVVNDQQVVCVFTKEKRIIISFPKANANFYATIRSEDDMADMLLMVLSFHAEPRKTK